MAPCTNGVQKFARYGTHKVAVIDALSLRYPWKQVLADSYLSHAYETSAASPPSTPPSPSSHFLSFTSDALKAACLSRLPTQNSGDVSSYRVRFSRPLNVNPHPRRDVIGVRKFSDATHLSVENGFEPLEESGSPPPPPPPPAETSQERLSEGESVQKPQGSATSRQQAIGGSQPPHRAPIRHHQMAGPGMAMRMTIPPEFAGKVVARLLNAPRFLLKAELLAFFRQRGDDPSSALLREEDVSVVLDERLRLIHWQLVFPSDLAYRQAQQCVRMNQRIGMRKIRLEQVPLPELRRMSDPRHPNRAADGFRGTSLIMTGAPDDASPELIERFFEGYNLAPYALRHVKVYHENVRTPLRMRLEGEWRPTIDLVERRTLVKFQTQSDCLRALRELHKEFLGDRAVELRWLQ